MLVYMVGNRCDLIDQREVREEDILKLQQELEVDYQTETSALTGQNVAELFETLTKHLYVMHPEKVADDSDDGMFEKGRAANELQGSFHLKNADLYKPKDKKKKGCGC